MKKFLFTISITCMVLGCHKKETARLSNQLTKYLEKAQNNTLPVEQRITLNNKALELILQSENKEDSLFFNRLFKVAGIYHNIKELEAYKTTSERIVMYAQQVKDTSSLAKAYEYIGDYYKQQSLKNSAYSYYLKAEKQYTQIQDKGNRDKMILEKAAIEYYDGDLIRSEISCLEALKSFHKTKPKNQRDIYGVYNLLGVVANDQEQYNKALEYHNKALQIITKDTSIVDRELLKIMSLNNIGTVYRNRNENKEALLYFAQALEVKDLYEKLPHMYAMLLDNTAYSRTKLKDDAGVEDLFYKALRIREALNIASGIVMSKLHLSEYYHWQKDSKKAFILADEAYKTAKTRGTDPRNVMLTLQQLQVVDTPSKEVYAIEYNRITDSLQQAQPKIHEAITQELAQAEADEKTEIKQKEQNQALLLWLGGILVVSALGGLIWHEKVKNKKREAKQKKELEQKEAQAQTVIKDKQTDLKVYDLLLSQQSKEKRRPSTKQMSFIKTFYDSIFNRILGLRLFLETIKRKDAQVYITNLTKMEEEIKTLYDFFNDMMIKDEQSSHRYFVQLLHNLIKQQRKHTTVTDYTDVSWTNLDTVVKIQVYRIIEDCFHVINETKQISLIELELFEEEDNEVIILNLDCNGIVTSSALKDVASHTNEIGGKLKVTHEGGGTTKIEVALAIKSPKLMASLGLQHTL